MFVIIKNRTATRLSIRVGESHLELAPLEARRVDHQSIRDLCRADDIEVHRLDGWGRVPLPLDGGRLFEVLDEPVTSAPARLVLRVALLCGYVSAVALVLDRLNQLAYDGFVSYDFSWPLNRSSEWWGLGISLGLLAAAWLWPGTRPHVKANWLWPWTRTGKRSRKERGGGSLLPWTVMGIGVGIPAIYLVARWPPGLLDLTVWPPRLSSGALSNGQAGFVAQSVLSLMFVALASMLPAMMYLQFDRQRLSALAERWLLDIFRLDRELTTLDDVEAKYGTLVSDYYGGILRADPRLRPVHAKVRAPVVVATLVLTVGWLLTLYGPGLSAGQLSGAETAGSSQAPPGAALGWFVPTINPATMGFLGSYVFCLMSTLRGYLRGDLRPKTYMVMAQRVLLATTTSWALGALSFDGVNHAILALCFAGGVVPETVLVRIQRTAQAHNLGFTPRGAQLAELDGMDLYDEARLREEGITCIQALVKHRFAELMLSTRIPVSRLVDWVDRALLIQHTSLDHRARLSELGINTATEVLATVRTQPDDDVARVDPARLAERVFGPAGEQVHHDAESRLQVLLLCLRDEERLHFLTNWRSRGTEHCCVSDRLIELPPDPAVPSQASSAPGQ